MNRLAAILPVADVVVDVDATSKKRAFEQAGLLFENQHTIARATVTDNLFARERLGSTGLGHGVAIPHGRIKGLKNPLAAVLRVRQARKRTQCFLQPLDPPVRDCNALAEARRAETLAVEQAVEDQVAGDSVVVLEQQADLFEQTLLAGYRQVEHDIARRQQLRD